MPFWDYTCLGMYLLIDFSMLSRWPCLWTPSLSQSWVPSAASLYPFTLFCRKAAWGKGFRLAIFISACSLLADSGKVYQARQKDMPIIGCGRKGCVTNLDRKINTKIKLKIKCTNIFRGCFSEGNYWGGYENWAEPPTKLRQCKCGVLIVFSRLLISSFSMLLDAFGCFWMRLGGMQEERGMQFDYSLWLPLYQH